MSEAARPYRPRAGSKVEAALAALARNGWMSAVDLADEIEVPRQQVHQFLAVAMKYGAVVRVPSPKDGVAGFDLPRADNDSSISAGLAGVSPPQPRNRALAAASHQIEPLSVAITDDGSILLIDGDRITARLTAQQLANIAALHARFDPAT